MGWRDESWRDRMDRQREERRQYENDVWYEAWRNGYNPDRATECAQDCYEAQRSLEQCVEGYASRVRAERERRELAQAEREYYERAGQEWES